MSASKSRNSPSRWAIRKKMGGIDRRQLRPNLLVQTQFVEAATAAGAIVRPDVGKRQLLHPLAVEVGEIRVDVGLQSAHGRRFGLYRRHHHLERRAVHLLDIDVLPTAEAGGFQPCHAAVWGWSSNSSRFPAGSCFGDATKPEGWGGSSQVVTASPAARMHFAALTSACSLCEQWVHRNVDRTNERHADTFRVLPSVRAVHLFHLIKGRGGEVVRRGGA